MNLIPTGLTRLLARQNRCLQQHYGHNQIRHFQARGLAVISLVFGLILMVFTLIFALMNRDSPLGAKTADFVVF